MTVSELTEILKEYPDDARVIIGAPRYLTKEVDPELQEDGVLYLRHQKTRKLTRVRGYSIPEWAVRLNVTPACLYKRRLKFVQQGMSFQAASEAAVDLGGDYRYGTLEEVSKALR